MIFLGIAIGVYGVSVVLLLGFIFLLTAGFASRSTLKDDLKLVGMCTVWPVSLAVIYVKDLIRRRRD